MKKTISLLVLLAWCAGATAQTVTVPDVEALPGETVAFCLNLSDGQSDTYTSLQFNATFPATGFTTTGDYTVSSFWKNATAVIGDVDATGLAVIPFASAVVIQGTAVDQLVTVSFTVDDEVAVGEYDVTLSDITFGYGFTDKDIADDITFKVKVVEVRTVNFDETATYLPPYPASEKCNVTMARTITAGNWSTIVLPFTLTQAKAKAAFGDDVQLAEFSGFEVDYGDDEENVVPLGITINFTTYTLSTKKSMTGGKPFLIKTSQDVSHFEAEDVTMFSTVTDVVKTDDFDTPGKFTGSLVTTTIPADGLFISGNRFWYSQGNQPINAFRCWLELGAVLEKETDFGVKFNVLVDGEDTHIDDLTNRIQLSSDVYDLYGRKAPFPHKGLYIVNGKKAIIK